MNKPILVAAFLGGVSILVGTLLVLPSVVSMRSSLIFEHEKKRFSCRCHHCILIALFVAAFVPDSNANVYRNFQLLDSVHIATTVLWAKRPLSAISLPVQAVIAGTNPVK